MILTRTPLRVSIAGGGTDLSSHFTEHGGAVCSFAINKYVFITRKDTSPLFPFNYRLVYSTVEEQDKVTDIEHPILRSVLSRYRVERADIDVMSDVPAGTGLGSSSAFTVGLHQSLLPQSDPHRLAELACYTEINELREPIGKQDQYAAAFGGLNLITFSEDKTQVFPLPLTLDQTLRLESRLKLIYVGGVRSASAILEEQTRLNRTSNLNQMTDLAYATYDAIADSQFNRLGPILARGWELKKELATGISTSKVDSVIKLCMENGATGAKLLGAGGTGFVLAYTERPTVLESAVRGAGLTLLPFQIEKEGSKVLYDSSKD